MKKINLFIVATVALPLLSGCSVYKAANVEGERPSKILACYERLCYDGLRDTEIVREDENGLLITFRTLKHAGSAVRALGHGVADVFTLGLWEFAGTPIEGALKDEDWYVYQVRYSPDGKNEDFYPGPSLRKAMSK